MTIRHGVQISILAVTCVIAGRSTIAQQPAVPPRRRRPPALIRGDSRRSADHDRTVRQRAALLHPREQEAREARRAAARRQRRLDARRRRPAGARALRRAHGVQRHEELPEAGHRDVHASRSACGSAPTSTRTRASTRPSTCCRCRPTSPDVLDQALLILEDWAHNVTFDPAEIDKERGVVIEEWRLRPRRAARGCSDKQFPVLLEGLALRRPAADRQDRDPPELQARAAEAVLHGLVPADLMAVVAVGDFDKAAVEALIKTHFAADSDAAGAAAAAGLRRAGPRRHARTRSRPTRKLTHDAASRSTARCRRAIRPRSAPTGSRSSSGCSPACCPRGSAEIAQKPDAPFLGAGAGRGTLRAHRRKPSIAQRGASRKTASSAGLEALFTEAERVARFGFTAPELDRQKRNMLRGFERAVAEKDNQQSATLADEYIRNFTQRRADSRASRTSTSCTSASCRRSRSPR